MLGRHSREGGNPFLPLEQHLVWGPAFAGTTPLPGFPGLSEDWAIFFALQSGRIVVGSVFIRAQGQQVPEEQRCWYVSKPRGIG
jgi:hypothetical protein